MGPRWPVVNSAPAGAYGIPVVWLRLWQFQPARDPAPLQASMNAFVAALLANETPDALDQDPRLAGYRALHTAIGKTGRQYLPAPESLLRRLLRQRALPARTPLVDAYALAAMETRVSIGAHDLAAVDWPVSLSLAVPGEPFHAIGETAATSLTAGEYVYRDAAGRVIGRLECRQALHSRVTHDTRDVLFILQGHATLGGEALIAAAEHLLARLAAGAGRWSAADLMLAA